MKPCKCENVKPNGDGTWQCMLCRRKFIFIPNDLNEFVAEEYMKLAELGTSVLIEEADEQLPVRDPE